MAIKIQYGGGQAGSAAGQIIAQAGQGNLEREQRARESALNRTQQFQMAALQIKAQRESQMRAIDVQADRDKQAADDSLKKTALKFGLDREMQEQEYDQAVQKMKEQAKIDAGLFTWKIGEQDKRKTANLNNAMSGWRTKFDSQEIDEETYLAGKAAIEKQIAGITPTAFAAEEKPPPLNEQVVQDPLSKAIVSKDRNGVYRVLVQPDKTMERLEIKDQQEAEAREQELRQKKLDAMQDYEDEIYKKELNDKLAGKSSTLRARVDAQMRARYGSEYELSEEDLRAAAQYNLEKLYPEAGYEGQAIQRAAPQQQPQQQAPSPQQAEAAIAETGDWWSPLEGQGVPVPEKYRNMSPDLGTSHAVYDAYMEKFGTFADVPEKYKPAVARMIVMINEQESEDQKERDVYERWKGALSRGE